jgi:hypothetical protein
MSDFSPQCQLSDCDSDAETTREHPEFGAVQVCSTCASLFGGADE